MTVTDQSRMAAEEACAREPIQIPGSIQPHGVLLVVAGGDEEVLQSAGDARSMFGRVVVPGSQVEDVLGVSLARLLDDAGAELSDAPAYLCTVQAAGAAVSVTGLRNEQGLRVLELETASRASMGPMILGRIRAMVEKVASSANIADACSTAAREVRRITGYNRVMVYCFREDQSGSVIAEERDQQLPPFLNHRYPASDIPPQARELYRRNPIRVIPNVGYVPASLVPPTCPRKGHPLNMSQCELRSVSPLHILYLRNMGVGASMSVSILPDGELWGLIACHNSGPKPVPYEVREMCRHLGQSLSNFVQERRRADSYRQLAELGAARDGLLARLGAADDPVAALLHGVPELQSLVPAHGVAICRAGRITAAGVTPPPQMLPGLAGWLSERYPGGDVFVTDCLSEHFAPAAGFTAAASGLAALVVPGDAPLVLMWFRAEQVEEIRWAGNPYKADDTAALGSLSPRRSFATWAETVWGRSRPFTAAEIEALRLVRRGLELLCRQHEVRELNIRLADANKRLAVLARTDVLTGVANRRAFDERLAEDWTRAARDRAPLAAIMLDVDFFKLYNDRYGHQAGDDCLRRVAQVLDALPRGTDFAARLGGEEFCLLLPGVDETGAARLAEVIRHAIEKLACEHPATPEKVVTVSLGVAAVFPRPGAYSAGLLEKADQALYAAKRFGRNRVVAASMLKGRRTSSLQ